VARRGATLALIALPVLLGATARAGSDGETLAIVVGRTSPVTTVSLDDLREIYLRRRRVWPNGTPVVPINLPPDNPLREAFSRRVLGRTPADLMGYWNARYFEGIRPPLVLLTPAAVRAYLQRQPEGIAYLPLEEVDDSLRVLLELRN
jgi:hypothetical protein